MKKLIFYLLSCTIIMSCTESAIPEEGSLERKADSNLMTIKSGTKFGFCLGYCFNELIIYPELEASFEKRSNIPNDKDYPTVIVDAVVSQATYDSIANVIDFTAFNNLADTLSDCLDCADGGAEWIEIIQAGNTKKVVFDAGADVEGFDELLAILRRLRKIYQ
ncbi:MAG: hypothetical protein AAGI07_02410 [Bacteroidota bacterium]